VGGFKFPDGSIQTTAWSAAYTQSTADALPLFSSTRVSILQLNLPQGTYLVTATAGFLNDTNNFGQDNSRRVRCAFSNDSVAYITAVDGGLGQAVTMTIHTILNITSSSGSIDVLCDISSEGSVVARSRRITAVRIGNLTTQ
jgi:hypothetical protein